MTRFLRCAVAFALATAACQTQASQQAATPASEFDLALTGRVSMNGTILSSACDIDTGNGWQTVAMGTETRGHMRRLGQGEPQSFTVTLKNCALAASDDPAPVQALQVTFDGEQEKGLFRTGGEATGVALELTDRNGEVITPGRAVSYQQAASETIRLDYRLRLKTTGQDLRAGGYHATLRYRVDYY